jgi:hypothetical protein
MDAKDLRKKLTEGLKPDSSGKSTPIQRLTPFLNDLVTYLEDEEHKHADAFDTLKGEMDSLGKPPVDIRITTEALREQVSSDDATRAATAQTNSESDGASKSSA